jgi:hypothetical protein
MLAVMEWLTTAALIVGAIAVAIVAVLVARAWRQGWREGSMVEMPGGETISPRPPDDRRPGGYE